ncbi:dephospho-CoA kinase [Thiobacillus denitrificans ATCC 25259]|uniref:Dephospho-CoA kinase n=1 Tax=Thiobacillus denitrificans (strain ATCC 25259 / T1) TaxID=292415 RepID=COAE_THIDA|nr:dephospho-CoA kinase [Thiobacillus denitrificans]Q3SGD0.1 RecName: Full=Dephospho-CoA kinase; AltName: Full=Dephosphocoenzyme A kinase [Thiobacillus denitrificans ATCC 25259]AAZ98320.1 dephospho-CoA kinase [Thiobacillus denitrificans ATCC 25259]
MFTIGLTGGIGSGKSAAAERFAELGVPVIDTDVIAHELTRPGSRALDVIRASFGEAVIAADGSLDRPVLRRRVFVDPAARRQLEAILHPLILHEVKARLASLSGPYAVAVIPLLVETGAYDAPVDRIAVVDCPEELQIARTIARSGLTPDEVGAILAAQAARPARLAVADDVIVNTGSLAALRDQVDALHQRYLTLAANRLP